MSTSQQAKGVPIELDPVHVNGRLRTRAIVRLEDRAIVETLDLASGPSRRRFVQRVAKTTGLPADTIEATLEAEAVAQLDERREGDEEEATCAPAWISSDGTIAEQICDPVRQRVAFVVRRPAGELTVEDRITDGDLVVRPVGGKGGRADAFVSTGAIKLPGPGVVELAPPSTRDALRAILRHIGRYVGLEPVDARLAAFWTLMTHAADRADAVPYLVFRGDYGQGKSRALQIVGGLCRRPAMISASPTPAVVFRLIDAYSPTLIIDEFNRPTDMHEDLVAILNAGYLPGATVLRCVGDDHEPRAFRCFGPKIIATRVRFKDEALASRCLVVSMPSNKPARVPTILDRERVEAEAAEIRDLLTRWRLEHWHRLNLTAAPRELADYEPRLAQLAAPLVALAPDHRRRARAVRWFQQRTIAEIQSRDDLVARVARLVVEHFEASHEPLELVTLRDRLDDDDGDRPTCRLLSNITNRLGLPRARPDSRTRRAALAYDPQVVERLRRRYVGPGRDAKGRAPDVPFEPFDPSQGPSQVVGAQRVEGCEGYEGLSGNASHPSANPSQDDRAGADLPADLRSYARPEDQGSRAYREHLARQRKRAAE